MNFKFTVSSLFRPVHPVLSNRNSRKKEAVLSDPKIENRLPHYRWMKTPTSAKGRAEFHIIHRIVATHGEWHEVTVSRPYEIERYNSGMGGVDLSDQRISYYHPDLKCHRNWIPMFLQIMSIVRNNAYIVYCEHFGAYAI